MTGRRKPRLVKLKEDIEKAFPGVSVHALQLDMQDAEAVTALPGTLPDKFQVIDILVNNAGKALGIAPVSPSYLWLSRLSESQVHAVLDASCAFLTPL